MAVVKSTTVSAVSALATALATAQGARLIISLDDVRKHMEWINSPDISPSPIPVDKLKFIKESMNFLLSDNAPRA